MRAELWLGHGFVTLFGLMFLILVSLIRSQIPWVRRLLVSFILIYFRDRRESERLYQPGPNVVQ